MTIILIIGVLLSIIAFDLHKAAGNQVSILLSSNLRHYNIIYCRYMTIIAAHVDVMVISFMLLKLISGIALPAYY